MVAAVFAGEDRVLTILWISVRGCVVSLFIFKIWWTPSLSAVVGAWRLSAESCFGSCKTVVLVCAGRRLTSEVESCCCFRRWGFQLCRSNCSSFAVPVVPVLQFQLFQFCRSSCSRFAVLVVPVLPFQFFQFRRPSSRFPPQNPVLERKK